MGVRPWLGMSNIRGECKGEEGVASAWVLEGTKERKRGGTNQPDSITPTE